MSAPAGKTTYNNTATHYRKINFSLANDSLTSFEEKKMPSGEILKLAVQVLIAFIGAIGNIFVTIVIGRLGRKKKQVDFYVQSLAIADLGTLLLTFPLAAIKEKLPLNWPFGEFACLYLSPVPEIFYGASVWCITVIAKERYRSTFTMRAPALNKNSISLKRAKTITAFVWVISFLIFSLPVYFVVEYHERPNGDKWCGPVWPSWDRELVLARVYIGLLTLFSYFLPLIFVSFTYFTISRAINKSNLFIKAMKRGNMVMVGGQSNVGRSVRLKHNKRVKKILTPVVLVFAVTMLPLNVLRLIIVVWPAIAAQKYYENLLYAVSVFIIANSSSNPVIYSVVSSDFRRAIRSLYKGQEWTINFSSLVQFQPFVRSSNWKTGQQATVPRVEGLFPSLPFGIFKKIESDAYPL